MERKAVLAKTAKGQDEIKSRTHGLAHKLRSILIMVDGSATAGDILAKFGGIPEIEAALDSLVSQGFVEIKGGQSAAPAAPNAPPSGATQLPAAPPQTRAQALSALTRFLIDNLGPDADVVTAALERARTPAEFLAAVERGAQTMAALRAAAKAQVFRDRANAYVEAHMGGG
jgi:hypothetical protein